MREVMPIIANLATNEGELLTGREEGFVAEGKGIQVFPFKDAAGNLRMITLVDGKMPVTFEGAGEPKKARGENTTGSSTEVSICSIALNTGKTYTNFQFSVTCRRDAYFKLVHNDNGTENILTDVIVGPGQYTFQHIMEKLEVVAGSTGVQEFKIIAKNFEALSALRGNVSCVEMINA